MCHISTYHSDNVYYHVTDITYAHIWLLLNWPIIPRHQEVVQIHSSLPKITCSSSSCYRLDALAVLDQQCQNAECKTLETIN